VSTRTQIAALQRRLGVTTVYVTHDQVEAMTMGDRVAVLSDGLLQQCDTPRALYDKPANAFVAGFIGSPAMNLVTAKLTADGAELGGASVPLTREVIAAADGDTVTLGFRPESLEVATGENAVPIKVDLVEELGSDAYVYGKLAETDAEGTKSNIVARVDPRTPPAMGDTLHLRIRADELHVFSATSGARLS